MTDNGADGAGMPGHHPHYHALALRLLLAEMTGDTDAHQRATNEVGRCPDCWQHVTDAILSEVADPLVARSAEAHGCDPIGGLEQLLGDTLDALAEINRLDGDTA